MATAKQVVSKAISYIGTHDNGNNNVKFNTAYYGKEVSGDAYPWCCVFQWYIFKECNASSLFYNGGKTASCGALMSGMASQKISYKETPKVGDLVIFDFTGQHTGHTHIGIVEKALDGGYIQTVEGNTSDSNYTNGGYVLRRKRSINSVTCYIRPKYDVEKNKNTVTLKSNGAIYQYDWKDPIGSASKVLKTLKTGAKVEFIKDVGYGWSKVKSGSVTGYIMNSHLKKSGLSSFTTTVLKADKKSIKIINSKKGDSVTLKKGKELTIICEIESGTYKGYSYLKDGSNRYYAKL
jgi:hypothetical protein